MGAAPGAPDFPHRPGLDRGAGWGLVALATLLAITAAWWALALWPLPAEAPEWMARARAACFGKSAGGLPDGGGWALLIGQPLGMLMFLFAVWGGAVTRGLEALRQAWLGRVVLAVTALLLLAGSAAAAVRVASGRGGGLDAAGGDNAGGPLVEMNEKAPALNLVDQAGQAIGVEQFEGEAVLVSFVFAHCATVCPLLVKDLLTARSRVDGPPPPVVLVTLDPWRDTPSRLPSIAQAWQLPDGVHLLSGDVEAVEGVLNRWKIPRVRNQANGEVIHPSVVYVVAPNGRLAYMSDGAIEGVVQAVDRVRR